MNLEKYLQQRVENEVESLLTEEDKLFIQQLIKKDEESKRQTKTETKDSKKD